VPQIIILSVSIVVAIAVALISLSWFFRDGEESTRSMQQFCDDTSNPFSFRPWWATKFGLWLGLAAGSGLVSFMALSRAWVWIAARL